MAPSEDYMQRFARFIRAFREVRNPDFSCLVPTAPSCKIHAISQNMFNAGFQTKKETSLLASFLPWKLAILNPTNPCFHCVLHTFHGNNIQQK
jgi:hypothetical protein